MSKFLNTQTSLCYSSLTSPPEVTVKLKKRSFCCVEILLRIYLAIISELFNAFASAF